MRVAIVGTGLMGASVALAAQRRGDEVVGWDAEPSALAAAVEVGAVQAASSLDDAVSGVELVVVAVPIAQLPATVATVLAASGDATVTDVGHTDPARHRLVHGFITDLGATPVAIDADAHDRLVAMTSHVPHVLANVVANQTGASRVDGHEPLAHAGGSLRDMTRIAGANPRI